MQSDSPVRLTKRACKSVNYGEDGSEKYHSNALRWGCCKLERNVW